MQVPQRSAEMVGRAAELRALLASYRDAADNKPQAVIVSGEAGLGKTRLLHEFLASIAADARILSGQCVDLGTLAPPYAPITNVLRMLTTQIGLEQVLESAGPGRDALAVLLPEVDIDVARTSNGGSLLEVTAMILERAAVERPTVVVIEDLHWADDATLAVLQFLLRAIKGGRILIAMSYRSDDVDRGHPLRDFLAEVDRGRHAKHIDLRRLSRTQVRRQAAAILGHSPGYDLVESVFGRSEGVPFYVEELLALPDGAAAGLPSTLRALLLARYECLDAPTQYFLRVIAAGGVSVRHGLAVRAFDGTVADFDTAARQAQQANVLGVDEDSYVFRHALVREAIHADLLPGERTRFHTRYAEAMESADGDRRDLVQIAYHWHAARIPDKTFRTALAAMAQAERHFAHGTAARMGERALDLWDRIDNASSVAGIRRFELLARTAAAHGLAGDGERSLALLKLAVADTEAQGPDRARLLADQARALGYNARPGSVPLLEEALRLVPPGADEALRATLLNNLAARHMLTAEPDRAIALATESLGVAQAIGAAAESSIASNLRGVSRIMNGDIAGGRADLEAAEHLAHGDPTALFRFRVNYSDTLHLLGLYDESIKVAQDGIAHARELGVERTTGALLSANAVEPLFSLGQWERGRTLMEKNLSLSPPGAFHAYLLRAQIWSDLWRGDSEAAARTLQRWQLLLDNLAEVEMQSRLQLTALRSELAWSNNALDEAWTHATFLLTPEFRPLPGHDLPLLAIAARILAARRRSASPVATDDVVEKDLRQLLAHDAFWPTHGAWAAVFDAELGGDGTGSDPCLWSRALEAVDRLPAHLHSYTLMRRGQAHFAAGDRKAAAADVRAAVAAAEALGAGLVAHQSRVFAEHAGITLSGTSRRAHTNALTTRERQVLELVATGLTNRQIGETLFISSKTASVHVSSILRKLGATSRTEAASHIHSLTPDGHPMS